MKPSYFHHTQTNQLSVPHSAFSTHVAAFSNYSSCFPLPQ